MVIGRLSRIFQVVVMCLLCGDRVVVKWVFGRLLWGYCLVVVWLSSGCHVVVMWLSCGCLIVIWLLFECPVVVVWLLRDCCVLGCQVVAVWLSG